MNLLVQLEASADGNLNVPGFAPALLPLGKATECAQAFKETVFNALHGIGGAHTPLGEAGREMAMSLGLGALGNTGEPPALIRFSMNHGAAHLLPELIPIGGDPGGWLWQSSPLVRHLRNLQYCYERTRLPMRKVSDRTLAILYQDQEDGSDGHCKALVDNLYRSLHQHGSRVQAFMTSQLLRAGQVDPEVDPEAVREVFQKFAAILFIGEGRHRYLENADAWILGRRQQKNLLLTINQMRREVLRLPEGGKESHREVYMPELIWANGCGMCAGTGEDSFPRLFMEAGARHFVGTAMEVSVRKKDANWKIDHFQQTHDMLFHFFDRWLDSKEDRHDIPGLLQESREKCGLPLQAGLYQLYEDPREAVTSAGGASPPVPFIDRELASLDSGMEFMLLSESPPERWTLERRITSDSYAQLFSASIGDGNGRRFAFVQIISPEWGSDPELREGLGSALRQLNRAGLSADRHLIPNRLSEASFGESNGKPAAKFLVLFRETPEAQEAWMCPGDYPCICGVEETPEAQPTAMRRLLALGIEVTEALEELHTKGLHHGSLSTRSILCKKDGENGAFLGDRVLLKDHWLHPARGRREVPVRVAAPESASAPSSQAGDVWGLGLALHELVWGEPPFEYNLERTGHIRSRFREENNGKEINILQTEAGGLLRAARACLRPYPELRPPPAALRACLRESQMAFGRHIPLLGRALHTCWVANCRLVIAPIDDGQVTDDLDAMACAIIKRGTPAFHCYGMVENEDQLAGLAAFVDLPTTALADGTAVATVCTLAIRGTKWWSDDPVLRRTLVELVDRTRNIVVLICGPGAVASLPPEFVAIAHVLEGAEALPGDLFDRVMDWREKAEGGAVSSEPVGAELARLCRGLPWKRVESLLRLALLERGTIDDRAAEDIAELLATEMAGQAGVTYRPASALPGLGSLALPPEIERPGETRPLELASWIAHVREHESGHAPPPPRRILLTGPPSCGKKALVRALARELGRSLVELSPDQFLSSAVGQAERSMKRALERISALGPTVVLVPEAATILHGPGSGGESAFASMLDRLSVPLQRWLEALPDHILAVFTLSDPPLGLAAPPLAPQWQWRLSEKWRLNDVGATGDPALRERLVALLFARHGLEHHARDGTLIGKMARSQELPKPAKDCAWWLSETIFLHLSSGGDENAPKDRQFWLDAINWTGDVLTGSPTSPSCKTLQPETGNQRP